MLDLIRKKQKSVLIQLVFWAIIGTFIGTIFLVWGKGRDSSSAQESYAVKINQDVIGPEQVLSAYENMDRIYRNLYGEAFTPELEKKLDLRKQALNSLIDQSLLMQEAERRKLKVTDKEVVESIAKISAFQENGVFDRNRYVKLVRSQRLTPDQFEALQRRDLLVEKVRTLIEGEAVASDAEIEQEYKEKNEKVDLSLVSIDPRAFEGRVQINATQLQSYFVANKEEFKLPDTVNLQFVMVDPKPFMDGATVTDADLKKYYERHLDRFVIPATGQQEAGLKKIEEVMDQVRIGAQEAKAAELAQEKAMDLYNVNRKGGSLQAVATALGAQIRETGFFTREAPMTRNLALPAEAAAVAFGLNPGELGRPVVLPQGTILFALKEKRPAHLPELGEVRPAVEAAFRKSQAKELARGAAEQVLSELRSGAAIQAVAAKHGLSATATGLFARNRNFFVPMVGMNEALSNAAFVLTAAAPVGPKVFEVDNAYVVMRLKERSNADPAGLTTLVRDEMRNAVLERKKQEILEKAVKDLRDKAKIEYSPAFAPQQEG